MSSNTSGQATFGDEGSIDQPETFDSDLTAFGVEPGQERESRRDEPEATEFGVDDRPTDDSMPDAGRQDQLATDAAQTTIEAETDAKPKLGDVYGATKHTPIPDAERNDVGTGRVSVDSRELARTPLEPHDFARRGVEVELGHDRADLESRHDLGATPEDQEHYVETDEVRVSPETVDPSEYPGEQEQDIQTQTATDEYDNEHVIHYDRNSEMCGTVRKHLAENEEHCPYCEDAAEDLVTDGGQIADVEAVAGDTVRLITGITGLMHSPEVIEGEASSSGKTIAVEHHDKSHRLDTETILDGDGEFRDSRYFEIYTPERLRNKQRSNHAPGPQAGANGISDTSDLPEPTHRPADEPAETPDETSPNPEEETSESAADKWDLSQYGRGSVLILEKYAGEFLVVGDKRTQFGDVLALHVIDSDGEPLRLRKTDVGGDGYMFDVRACEMRGGQIKPVRTQAFRNVDDIDDVREFEKIGEDTERLREWIRSRYHGE
ncbi:hypothetical protein [Halorubrum salinum]|uniref:hypothetical protein n=1 Tax=Halorubrum salinum TaxID=767517 RepID=UPI002111876F|nr:hypothetical protein [Halorubrum salinum]